MTRTIEDPRMTEAMLVMGLNGEEVAEMRVRKTREGKPKSRNGCRTCKLRRVKCDETKPHCMRCTRFGQRCDGYIAKAPSKQSLQISTTRTLAPRESSNPRDQSSESPNPSSPSPLVGSASSANREFESEMLSSQDQDALQMQEAMKRFSVNTAAAMGHSVDLEKWMSWVAQCCERDEGVRYSVCAFGVDPEESTSLDNSLYDSLTGCLMLFCFDDYGLDSKGSDERILSGLHQLRDQALEVVDKKTTFGGAPIPSLPVGTPTNADITIAFTAIERQSIDAKALQALNSYLQAITVLPPFTCPQTFETVPEARSSLEQVLLKSTHYIRCSRHRERIHPNTSQLIMTREYIHMNTINGRVHMPNPLAEYEDWDRAYGPLLKFARSKGSSEENFLAASLLRLCWLAGWLVLNSHIDVLGRDFASLDERRRRSRIEVEELVSIAELLLKKKMPSRSVDMVGDEDGDVDHDMMGEGSAPAFELQVLVPVMTVAWCCRHRSLRRLVVDLLGKGETKEGILNGVILGRVMNWLEQIEEEGLEGEGEEFVPNVSVLRGISVWLDVGQGMARVRCLKPLKGGNSRQEVERDCEIAFWG